jgi:glutamate dehydrogenase (NADP+)
MYPPKQQGKRCMVSGSGNVAQYAAKKLIELGAVVLTMSDSTGYIYEPNGFSAEQIEQVMDIKNRQRTTLAAYNSATGAWYHIQHRCWMGCLGRVLCAGVYAV